MDDESSLTQISCLDKSSSCKSQCERHTWATKEQASAGLSRYSLRPLAASPRWDLHRDVAFTWP
eukprot:4679464-Pleurochrysis_carterae.AAC.1